MNSRILGISPLGHDSAVAVIDEDEILFAAHSERYSRIKNDPNLNEDILSDAFHYGPFDYVYYCEKPWLKRTRNLRAGQYKDFFEWKTLKSKLKSFGIPIDDNFSVVQHHWAHMLSGYRTCNFTRAVIVCIDSIGEWDTITIWKSKYLQPGVELVARKRYPNSVGLLYSAFTQRCGLKPNEEEYIMMGMAPYGKSIYADKIRKDFIDLDDPLFRMKINCHKGIGTYLEGAKVEDIAASIQKVTEEIVLKIIKYATKATGCRRLVYAGGVALNCVINSKIRELVDDIWIIPNPGDAGTCIGADSIVEKVYWDGPFLGHDICEDKESYDYPVEEVLNELLKGNIVGVAHGKAEFGPRALGNRSLLADPRFPEMKDRVNKIKRRQKYRPFAPAILEEKASEYFDCNFKSPYMQFVVKCKEPKKFPAIVHVDKTSRIQTVSKDDNPGFYELLKRFYEKTSCPMLLNTSLNVRGEPLVNSLDDVKNFREKYDVKIF